MVHVHHVVVMRVGDHQVGDVGRLESALLETRDQQRADAEAAGVDQRDPATPADQRDGAPAEAAVAHGLARIALDHDVDVVAVDMHAMILDEVAAHSARCPPPCGEGLGVGVAASRSAGA